MMKGFAKLTKFQLKYYLKPKFENKKQRNKFIGLGILIAVSFLAPIFFMVTALFFLANTALELGVMHNILAIIFSGAQLATIFLGTATYMQVMYFSKDNEILLTLPVSKNAIFLSKLIVVYCINFLVSTLMVLPTIVVTAVATKLAGQSVGLAFYLLSPVAIVMLPLLPILLISIVSFPIMKILNYLKTRPLLGTIIVGVLISAFLLAIYIPMFSMQGQPPSESGDMISADMIQSLVSISRYMIHPLLLASAMMGIGVLKNIMLFFVLSLSVFGISLIFSSWLYVGTTSAMLEGVNYQRKTKTVKEIKAQSSRKKAYLGVELKSVMRNTSLSVNSFMQIIMTPLFVFLYNSVMGKSLTAELGSANANMMIISLVAFFGAMMLGGTNYIASIGFSRDRENFQLLKTFPMEIKDILWAKLTFADLVSAVGVVISGIVFALTTKGNIIDIIMFFITIFAYSYSLNAFALMRDLKNPKLKWMNIKEITKNNFSIMVPMLIAMAGGLVLMIVGNVLAFMSPYNQYITSSIFWSVFVVIDIVYYFIFRHNRAEKALNYFENIEV